MIKHSRSVVATALLASAIVVAGGLQASAHNPPGDKTNAITANALTSNALTSNGWQTNALTANALTNNGINQNALTANTITSGMPSAVRLGFGGETGLTITGIELPR